MNRCRTKFIWFIGHKQFRYHNYLKSCEACCEKAKFAGKCVLRAGFASAFDMRYDFKRTGCIHKEDVQTMNTPVAKMIHGYMEWVSQLQLC